jgi:thiol-disulfide isomerase/thioredoxin
MDSGGRYRELAEFRGRPVVLNFWATWCRPCRDELPLLDRVYRRYRERGLEVVAISIDEKGWRAIRPFLSSHPVSFPILLADSRTRKSYGGPPVVPTTWFLDRRGRVVATHREGLEEEQLRGVVELLLAED